MNRFTRKSNAGQNILYLDVMSEWSISTPLPPNEQTRIVEGDAIDCLSAYEDTGLTPADISTLRNELCLKCGRYKEAHNGACDGCRWHRKGENV